MAKLHEAGVKVVWIRGNHDAACRLTKHLELPNVCELPWDEPGTRVFDELGIAVHGQGFATQSVTRDLSLHYPEPIAGAFNIGLLHTAVEGAEGHAPYAPCKLPALVNKGYAYWALGHVHQRTVLHEAPWVVFPGNLQGRNVRETGPKGATLVSLNDAGVERVEHRPLDVVRYEICRVDVSGAGCADEIVERVVQRLEHAAEASDGNLLAVRVIVSGATPAHVGLETEGEHWIQQIRSAALFLRSGSIWLEKVLLRTESELDIDSLASRDDAAGELARALLKLREDPEDVRALLASAAELRPKLPSELQSGPAFGFEDANDLRSLLQDVEHLLLPRLLARGGP
jgi:DNA repair exonuclease SbcCD nuclease subunit